MLSAIALLVVHLTYGLPITSTTFPVFEQLGVSPFYQGMPASAKVAACGFMIFGCGVEMAGITVSRGIVKWFKGREMALAMGSEMALARLGVCLPV